ncbi:hypothetical protein V1389_06765 [Flavobacterium rakeshii]|uniref:hypothetical protein n=1 Tax=Flavobacterium rakeshii TaxID=1038845 RepID=UPI002E7BB69B|nr:hypothetical protein [Flavobacterium rakeshii]MEE1898028.1 hypothetical protein [Flavobacterium rakeshii]
MDLDAGEVIAQTKQVNDLNSLEDRQSSFTNKFKLPKTANNVRALDHMTLTGNASNVPYKKNQCTLYNDLGECFINNGYTVITDSGDYYEAVVYDGIVDLFKTIENDSLANLSLENIEHIKNITSVINSWNQDLPYRYILADYNGQYTYLKGNNPNHSPIIFIDYLVPSINVAWLWDKIFKKYGFEYSGSIFESDDFKNLWLTYPKGSENTSEILFKSTPEKWHWKKRYNAEWKTYSASYYQPEINELEVNWSENDDPERIRYLKAPQSGMYRLNISGNLGEINTAVDLVVCKNADAHGEFLAYDAIPIPEFYVAQQNIQPFTDFSTSKTFRLEEGETVCLVFRNANNKFRFWNTPLLSVTFTQLEIGQTNFTDVLSDFSIKDFLKEIIYRFGLVLYKDKNENKYEFITLTEQLTTPKSVDWSKKFARKLNEKYVYGSYAQQNWFRYKYNSEGATHNDHYIRVSNENLNESKDSIKSKIYSPESYTSPLNGLTNIYKFWEKEVVEATEENEATVSYKSLDKRFYLMRSKQVINTTRVWSMALAENTFTSKYYKETFERLSFFDIINTYYTPLKSILEKALIVNAEMFLNDTDITNFDFKKLYYIDALSGYFLVNKINNYIPGKLTKCELVRVNYSPPQTNFVLGPIVRTPSLTINNVVRLTPTTYHVGYYTNFPTRFDVLHQYSPDGVNWKTGRITVTPQQQDVLTTSVKATHFRLLYNSTKTYSNIFKLD